MHNVDITMAPIICSAFTLRPSTSSRGSHPQTYNCSRWLWIAWMIVSNFIGFVLELFCMCIKSFTIASFGFGGFVSLVDPFLCHSSIHEGASACVLLPETRRSPDPCMEPLLAFSCVGTWTRAFRSATWNEISMQISCSNFLSSANHMRGKLFNESWAVAHEK